MTVKSPYGLTFGAQGNLQPVPDRIATMTKMGIGNMRLFCNWDAIEIKDPNTGEIKFDFTILDGVIRLANQAGIAVTYCLDSAPAWHQDNTLCSGKAFMIPEDAASFLAMIAHRYTIGDPTNPGELFIVGIEGANEGYSDGAQHCQVGPYAAQLMKAVYPAVKAVNPNLVVGSPAIIGLQLSYITDWMEAFYSNGGGDYSDYDHFHFYTQLSPSDTPEPGHASFAMYYQAMAAVQAKYSYSKKPLRCTEIGWAVPGKSGSFTYQQQSDNYLQALDIARQSQGKLEMVELFTIGGSDGFSPVEHMGDKEVEHELVAAHSSYVKQYPTWDTGKEPAMSVDETGAIPLFVDRQRVFINQNTHTWVVIHKTASGGTVQDIAHFFENDPHMASVHYVVGQDGSIGQCVLEVDGAGGNCCLETGHASYLPLGVNLNVKTISIEHVDPASDNSTPLTDAQKAASFKLVYDICKRHNIPMRRGDANGGIIGHSDIAPLSRARCPGNYPWDELFAYLVNGGVMSTIPQGWHDDGTTLTAPNGVHVVHGFREWVLSHNWDAANWPLEAERGLPSLEDSNPSLGAGTQQMFRWTMLGYTQARGVFLEWIGQELIYDRQKMTDYYHAIQQLTAQVQQLQAQQGNPQEHALLLQVKQIVAPIS